MAGTDSDNAMRSAAIAWTAALSVAVSTALPLVAHASGLAQLKAFLDSTRTAQGTFRQEVASKTRPSVQDSGGTFAFARPGRFRWTYEKPYEQLIVGDGMRVWVYDRDLNQVIVRKLDLAVGATPAALLAGDNALDKNFTLTEGAAAGDLEYVDAAPKTQESQFTKVRIGFRDNVPRAMELTDTFGQITSLTFVTFERNPTLAPTMFRFDVPAGADVVGETK